MIEVKLSTDFVTLNFDLSLPPFKNIDINYLNALKYIHIIPSWIASTRSHTWNKKYYANSEIRRKKKVWRISRFGARGWHQEATLWQANLGTGFIRRSS